MLNSLVCYYIYTDVLISVIIYQRGKDMTTTSKEIESSEKEKGVVYCVLWVITIVSFIIGISCLMVNLECHLFFCSATVFIIVTLLAFPLEKFNRETSNKPNLFLGKRLMLCFNTIFCTVFILTLYIIVYLPYQTLEDNFLLVELSLFFIIILTVKQAIAKITNKKTDSPNKRKNVFSYLGVILALFLSLFMSFYPFLNFYKQEKVVNLNNLQTPYKIQIYAISKDAEDRTRVNIREVGTINDDTIIGEFIDTSNKLTVKNIRNIDILKYWILEQKSYPYYRLSFIYKDENNRDIYLWKNHKLSQGYIHVIEVLENNRVIIKNSELNISFIKNNYYELYSFKLTDSFIKQIKKFAINQ